MSDFTNTSSNIQQVQQTVTGMEQVIAGGVGLITAGPLGAVAAWGVLKGVQGKWAPWTVCGFVAAPILCVVQFVALSAVAYAAPVAEFDGTKTEEVRILTPDYSEAAAVSYVDVPSAFNQF
jgi:hypothetical protein